MPSPKHGARCAAGFSSLCPEWGPLKVGIPGALHVFHRDPLFGQRIEVPRNPQNMFFHTSTFLSNVTTISNHIPAQRQKGSLNSYFNPHSKNPATRETPHSELRPWLRRPGQRWPEVLRGRRWSSSRRHGESRTGLPSG